MLQLLRPLRRDEIKPLEGPNCSELWLRVAETLHLKVAFLDSSFSLTCTSSSKLPPSATTFERTCF